MLQSTHSNGLRDPGSREACPDFSHDLGDFIKERQEALLVITEKGQPFFPGWFSVIPSPPKWKYQILQ